MDLIKNGEVQLVVNTTEGRRSIEDSSEIRKSALQGRVAYCTTIGGAFATLAAVPYLSSMGVASLQELHQRFEA